ncbi:hypothetical protein BG011_000559 [Mortierella polycephala]|uniref:Uncharacterized protein n=1 Tax=Mortierella polycephala TaxID=41804 RepID=A0A9P6TUS6_9FUNG|nr:hypothetical protein BG011_000559 [Mortierella polycephala]
MLSRRDINNNSNNSSTPQSNMPSTPTPRTRDAETSMQSSTMSDSVQPITPRKRRLSTDTILAPTAEPMRLIHDRESFLKSLEALDVMMEEENRGQIPTALLAGPRTDVHSFGKRLRVQPPAMSNMKRIPGSKTTAAGVRAAAEARAVARNTTVAVATGVVIEVPAPSPSSAPVRSSFLNPNSPGTITPWTVPPERRFTLLPEVMPANPDIGNDQEVPEPEQNNSTVAVVPSSVGPSSPINLLVAANLDVARNAPRGSTRGMRPRPSTTQEGSRRFTPLGYRPSMLRRSSAMSSLNFFEDTTDDVQIAKMTEQMPAAIDRPSIETMIGSSQKQQVPTKTLTAASTSSKSSLSSPSIKTRAARVRATPEARAVARNTTVAVATGVVVDVPTPSPSPTSVRSSSSAPNSQDAIEPWTAPLARKTERFTLPLETIPEDTGIRDDEEAPEPEKNNRAVNVAPSSVDSVLLSITESQESAPGSSSSTNLTAAANFDVARRAPRGSAREMRPRPSATQERPRRFTPLGFRPPMMRRSSAWNSLNFFEDTADEAVGTDLDVSDVVVVNNTDKVSDDVQIARMAEQTPATIDRPSAETMIGSNRK